MMVSVFGREITNDNARGLCSDKYCGKEYTHYFEMKIGNIETLVPFCKKHTREIEENLFFEVLNHGA